MIDLGAWASDAYSIAGKAIEGDDTLDELSVDDNAQNMDSGAPTPYQH